MGFNLTGKCVFCEFHKLVNQHYFGCKNPSEEVAVRSNIPMGGDYPEQFLPAALATLDGRLISCPNWQKKVY
jgi:hypothetical protein